MEEEEWMMVKDIYDYLFYMEEKEVLIKRKFAIDRVNYLMLAASEREGAITLWMLYEEFHDGFDSARVRPKTLNERRTNHDEMMDRISGSGFYNQLRFREISFGDKRFMIGKGAYSAPKNNHGNGLSVLQHFLDHGLDVEDLQAFQWEGLRIAKYELGCDKDIHLEDVDFSAKVKLRTHPESVSVVQFPEIVLPMGEYDEPVVIEVQDELKDRSYEILVDEISNYDLWNVYYKRQESRIDSMTEVSEEEKAEMKERVKEGHESICPKGMNLAILSYRVQEKVNVTFRTKKWLNTETQMLNCAHVFLVSGDDRFPGSKGCHLDAVEKDFDGELIIGCVEVSENLGEREIVIE